MDYLFEVTQMSIHCPTNSLQKFKPFLCLNIRKSCNLDRKESQHKGTLPAADLFFFEPKN